MTKLHLFDMDGTLLTGSACLEISRHLGHLAAVDDIEERWARGEVGHVEFYDILVALWDGLEASDIDAVFRATPWLDGVKEVFADIAARGEHSAVISLSPQFFVDRLLDWDVSTVHGAGVEPGRAVDPSVVLTPESKVTILEQLLEAHGVTEDECVAYGDSSSDIPLFQRLPNTVAVNAAPSLQQIAARHYQGTNLWDAYQLGRELLDHRVCTAEDGAAS